MHSSSRALDDDLDVADAEYERWLNERSVKEAWDEWRKHSCVEVTGGHQWLAVFDADTSVALECANLACPAAADDILAYGSEVVCCDVPFAGGVVRISYGEHDWQGPGLLVLAVAPAVIVETHGGGWYPPEVTAWIELEPR